MARYYSSGRKRFVYASEATFRCPWADGAPALEEAAERVGMTRLDAVLRNAHRRGHAVRLEQDGKKTDLCATCGAKLEKVGYRVWILGRYEDVVAELRRLGRAEDAERVRGSERISERLGGDGWTTWPDSDRYFGKKTEAISWCREQAQIERGTAETP